MPEAPQNDDVSSLERARARLYKIAAPTAHESTLPSVSENVVPHTWEADPLTRVASEFSMKADGKMKSQVRFASSFFFGAVAFFIVALCVAAYMLFAGGNTVSVNKIAIAIHGPTSITGGDSVSFSVDITNTNTVALRDTRLEMDFPATAKRVDDVGSAYPRFTDTVGTLESGATVTRSVQVRLFGAEGQTLQIPIKLSYGAQGSNAVFVKKTVYPIIVSSTPLAVSIEAPTETVSGQLMTLSLIARSNASIPIENVMVTAALPFGFTVRSSSIPMSGSGFYLGTLLAGATEKITLTGVITGEQNDQRVFHFTIGTTPSQQNQTLAASYMTQDVPVNIAAPFLNTVVTINGDASKQAVLNPGTLQNVTIAYTNMLPTSIANATIKLLLSGTGIDLSTIQATRGFYDSADHSIVFSRDTDPAFAMLAPGASGVSSLSFRTLDASALPSSPTVTLATAVSGTRIGQANVPEQISASASQVAKVMTAVSVASNPLHVSSPIPVNGPIPPRVGQATTYAVQWSVQTYGTAIAGGTMTAILPSYVTYTGVTNSADGFSYDSKSRAVTWNVGDLAPSTVTTAAFQVSLTPSTSQRGKVPTLVGAASFTGHDRFTGMQVTNGADSITTETKTDTGYVVSNAVVQ